MYWMVIDDDVKMINLFVMIGDGIWLGISVGVVLVGMGFL